MKMSRVTVAAAIGGALLCGLGIGAATVANAASDPSQSVTPLNGDRTDSYPTNEFGLTVGTPTLTDVDARNLPDLIPSPFKDSPEGFLKAKEIYLPDAKNPDEAVAQMKQLYNDDGQMIVKAYSADGKTVIGTGVFAERVEGGPIDPR